MSLLKGCKTTTLRDTVVFCTIFFGSSRALLCDLHGSATYLRATPTWSHGPKPMVSTPSTWGSRRRRRRSGGRAAPGVRRSSALPSRTSSFASPPRDEETKGRREVLGLGFRSRESETELAALLILSVFELRAFSGV